MTTLKPPRHLGKSAKALWRSIAEEIELDCAGAMMLTLLCENWQLREEARLAIAKSSPVILDRFKQEKPSPWVAVARDCTLAIQRSFRALGLDLLAPEEKK
jgi:phage terminase small subunit